MISAPCGSRMLRRSPRRSTRARLMRCVVLSFATLNRARKAAAAAAAVARGSTPVPVKAMWLMPEAAFVATSRLAVRVPAAEGTNWTPIAQAAPEGMTAPPQVLLTTRKSAAAGPLRATADTARLEAPAGSGTPKLVTVAPCGAAGVPSAWPPKSSPDGPVEHGHRRTRELASDDELVRRGVVQAAAGQPEDVVVGRAAGHAVRCRGVADVSTGRDRGRHRRVPAEEGPDRAADGAGEARARREAAARVDRLGSSPLVVRRHRRRSERLRRGVGRVRGSPPVMRTRMRMNAAGPLGGLTASWARTSFALSVPDARSAPAFQ